MATDAKAKPSSETRAGSKPQSPMASSAEQGGTLKNPTDAKSARPALGGLLRANAHKDAQQVCFHQLTSSKLPRRQCSYLCGHPWQFQLLC